MVWDGMVMGMEMEMVMEIVREGEGVLGWRRDDKERKGRLGSYYTPF